jgi:hypothetical protein
MKEESKFRRWFVIWMAIVAFYYRIKPVRHVAIDVMSITGMQGGGKILKPAEILDHYIRTNVLIYDGRKGHIPIPLKRRSRIKLIDSRSEKGQKLLKRLAAQSNKEQNGGI